MLDELIQQAAPLLPEQVGSGKAAVSTDHAQVGDAVLHKVVRGPQSALVGTKLFTAGAADDCATLRERQITIWNHMILYLNRSFTGSIMLLDHFLLSFHFFLKLHFHCYHI